MHRLRARARANACLRARMCSANAACTLAGRSFDPNACACMRADAHANARVCAHVSACSAIGGRRTCMRNSRVRSGPRRSASTGAPVDRVQAQAHANALVHACLDDANAHNRVASAALCVQASVRTKECAGISSSISSPSVRVASVRGKSGVIRITANYTITL